MGCREAKNYRDNVVQVHPSIINSIVQLTAVCLLWVPELHPTPPPPSSPFFCICFMRTTFLKLDTIPT